MRDKETLVGELNQSTHKLLGHLSAFSETEFNFHPSANQWSAGDIAEHLLMIESKMNDALNGTVLPTEREPDSKAELFRAALQNRSQAISATESVHPSAAVKHQEEILNKLHEQRNKLKDIVLNTDLSLTCMDFSHPRLGKLTRLEWLLFTIYHADRHIEQLQMIKESIASM
jgi:uncharacterized damage-inducible protein DinB